jgi:hypothetical protein
MERKRKIKKNVKTKVIDWKTHIGEKDRNEKHKTICFGSKTTEIQLKNEKPTRRERTPKDNNNKEEEHS